MLFELVVGTSHVRLSGGEPDGFRVEHGSKS